MHKKFRKITIFFSSNRFCNKKRIIFVPYFINTLSRNLTTYYQTERQFTMRNLTICTLLVLGLCCLSAFSRSEEYGYAAIYSQRFEGSRTASGELFSHSKRTAAHKSLPFGTQLRVTCLENGKSVIVRINDRGPFVENRVTDLSQAAANELGFNHKTGEIKVKLEAVPSNSGGKRTETSNRIISIAPEEVPALPIPNTYGLVSKGADKNTTNARTLPRETNNPKPIAPRNNNARSKSETIVNGKSYQSNDGTYRIALTRPPKNGYAVQVSFMRNNDNMLRKTAELQENYFRNVLVNVEKTASGEPLYRVMVGPFDDKNAALSCQKNLKKRNIEGFIVDLSK